MAISASLSSVSASSPSDGYRLTPRLAVIARVSGPNWNGCENTAIIYCDGKLGRWENVQLTLLDAQAKKIDGKIYGKIISIKPVDNTNCSEVTIHFTSVPPKIRQVIQRASEGFIEMDEVTTICIAASGI